MDEETRRSLDHLTAKLDDVLKLLHTTNGLVTRVALLEQRVSSNSARLWDSAKIIIIVVVTTLANRYYGQ